MQTIMSIDQVAQAIADNVKTKKWLSCTFQVQTEKGVFSVGVKTFGKWVQRVECCGMADGLPEQKTVKALREESARLIGRMLACV